MGVGGRQHVSPSKNGKRELISDIWGKRGATYGEKGVSANYTLERRLLLCLQIDLPQDFGIAEEAPPRPVVGVAAEENSFLTYGGNGVRHMGEMGVWVEK